MPFNYSAQNEAFDLGISFTSPAGATATAVFFSTISGTVTSTGTGGVLIDFGNQPRTLPFNGGTFTVAVDDVSIPAGGAAVLSGTLVARPFAVSEPDTLVVLGMMLLGLVSLRGVRE